MAPRSWQTRLRDAFSGLSLPPETTPPPPPPRPVQGYASPPPHYNQTFSAVPSRPTLPLPLVDLPIIEAELLLPSGEVIYQQHDLDTDLGNDFGTFTFGGKYFSKSARNVYVHDATLYAELANGDRGWYPDKVGIEVDIPEDLRLDDIAIHTVEYHVSHSPNVPNERSRLAVSTQEDIHSLRLISGFVLAAECKQADGTYATSYADLDSYISNEFGEFKRGARHFSKTAGDIRLSGTTLQAKLGDNPGGAPARNIDVSRIFRCANGRFVPFDIENPSEAAEPARIYGISEKSSLDDCRSAHIVGRQILVARCILRGGRSKEVAFSLDSLFGILCDTLRPFGHDFSLHPLIELSKFDGSIRHLHIRDKGCLAIDLAEFIANVNGKLALKEGGPCNGCSRAFRANRIYSPIGDEPHREKLDFNLSDVNSTCALCKIIESIITNTVPFIRSCEVHIECSTEYFPSERAIKTVELEVSVNNIEQRFRVYLDETTDSKAYELMPSKEHSDAWF